MTDRPRMRTAPQAIAELKKIDPDTAFTLTALKRLMKKGEIPVVRIESKMLINLDVLIEYLNCTYKNPTQEDHTNEYGKIRRIAQ